MMGLDSDIVTSLATRAAGSASPVVPRKDRLAPLSKLGGISGILVGWRYAAVPVAI